MATENIQAAVKTVKRDFKARYAQAAIYTSIGGTASQILYGLTPVIVARSVGPHDYGVYAVVMSLVAIVTGLLSLGQNSILHKLLPEYSVKDKQKGGAILANTILLTLALLIILSSVLMALSGWLAKSVYRDAELTTIFRWAVLATMTMVLFNLASSVIAGLQDFRTYNLGLFVRSFALIAMVWLGIRWFGLPGAIAGQMLAGLVGLALIAGRGWPLAHERFPGSVQPSLSRPLLRVMADLTLPTLVMTILNLPGYWWVSTMLARHSGFAEAGHFSVAYTIAQLIFLLPIALYTPAMTFMSEAHAVNNSEIFSRLVGANLRWLWSLTLPLALSGALLSPVIIDLFFGAVYVAAVPAAFVMSLAALLMVNTGLLNTAIIAAGRAWQGCGLALLWVASFLVAGFICIPRWGAMGGAIGFTVSQVLYFILAYLYSRWELGVADNKLGRLTILTCISGVAAICFSLLLKGTFFYLAGLILLLVVASAEWLWISDASERRRMRQTVSGIAAEVTGGLRARFV